MVRRILFALLVACLALPAVAAPTHCAPPSGHHATQGQQHHPAKPAPIDRDQVIHGCIGCAAPSGLQAQVTPPIVTFVVRVAVAPSTLLPNPRDGPDTPPPRLA